MTGAGRSSSRLRTAKTNTSTRNLCNDILHLIFARYKPIDFAVRLWDGTRAVSPDTGKPGFTLVINHPAALRKMFMPPSERRLGEAYIYGDFDIEGDIIQAAGMVNYFQSGIFSFAELARLITMLISLPAAPTAETTDRPGFRSLQVRHSRRRDRQAVQFHYDLSNNFYRLWLDSNMVYSCAYYTTGSETINAAQVEKLDRICRKLNLQPGQRLLDIGCGWGALILHAAMHHGVSATGITLSKNQHYYVQARIEELGLSESCHVNLQDYRDMQPEEYYDRIVSIGMFEHVGAAMQKRYFKKAWEILAPGGLFINHAIASIKSHRPAKSLSSLLFQRNSFMNRYVFPDGELLDINESLQAAEAVGFEVRDVESLREHYQLTLEHWVNRLERNHQEALQYVDEVTYRVWKIYMAGVSQGFSKSVTSVYQTVLSKNTPEGKSNLPYCREHGMFRGKRQ